MGEKKCNYTAENGVAVMTIDNPPVNALSQPVLADMKDAFTMAFNDDSVRVIVFTGAGKAFIAGADINEFKDLATKQEGSDYLINGQEVTHLIESGDKPVIAAINGFCLGGGMEMALACHICLADEKAQIGLPEIKLGIIPGYGGTQRTTRLIGTGRAMELVLSGNFVTGEEAARYGIVNRAAPAGQVMDEAMKLAGTIAAKSRMNVTRAMTAIQEGLSMDLKEAMKLERDLFGECCTTGDKNIGVAAFLEKKEPDFQDK